MSGKAYQDPQLTNIALGYRPWGHINQIILPTLQVRKPSAKIGIYDDMNMRIVSTIKAPEGKTPVVTTNISTADAYLLEDHALKSMASDKDAENEDAPFNIRRDRTELVMDLLSTSREYGLANFMNTSGNFTNVNTLSGTSQWGDSADDPLGDIKTAQGEVADAHNIPDEEVSIVMSRPVWRKFTTLPEVKDVLGFKYNQTMQVTGQQVADALGFRQLIIANGRYNSAADGQTSVFANLWGKHCWAVNIPRRPKIKQYAFGYTPRRKAALAVDRYYDYDVRGWWIRCTDEYDQYIVSELGVSMIEDAVA